MPEAGLPPGDTLWDALLGRRQGNHGLQMMTNGGGTFLTWGEVFKEAARRSKVLRSFGVEEGWLVAGVLTNTVDALIGLFAVWFAGASFASLPSRSRGMGRPEYLDQLCHTIRQCDAPVVLGDDLADGTWSGGGTTHVSVHAWSSLDHVVDGPADITPPPSDAPLVVQFSSGSTGSPKGCLISARAILRQEEMLREITHVSPGNDVVYCWVPMSHDMGLFGGLLLACYNDATLALSSPERFMMSPRTWFSDLAATKASVTTGTTSALTLALRAHRGQLATPFRTHSVFIGAEPVDWSVMQAATEAFAPSGLAPTSLRTAYGMAEITLVASCGPFGQPAKRLVLDREALEYQEILVLPDDAPPDQSVSVTSQGFALAGTVVASNNGDGVGELHIKSPSVANGYFRNPEATSAAFHDGIFESKDLGFVHEGEVFVLGRTDDVYIDGGRNVYLNDLETSLEEVVDARKGRVFLVDLRDGPTPRLVALLELRSKPNDPEGLAGAVHRTVMARCGVPVAASLFVAKGQLPLTPSGKKQRLRSRQLLQRRGFDVIASGGTDPAQLL